jgi:hypothetical protein
MMAHWFGDGPEPDVLADARTWIGGPGFRVRGSASYASAVYSGVFCLLAIQHAQDWRRGESIQLQELQDHHIFPQAYLKRHGISKKAELNTIANRTLISNETNGKIRDKAPADYLADTGIFPTDLRPELLEPHFIAGASLEAMHGAAEVLPDEQIAEIYERFLTAREAAIIAEVRHVCGIDAATPSLTSPDEEPEGAEEDLAADAAQAEVADPDYEDLLIDLSA